MPRLTVLMGAPGSGKSTYASRVPNTAIVSNDGKANQSPGSILHSAYKQINQHLAAGRDVVFDTTGANPNVRKAAVTIAAKHGAQVSACVMDTSLKACLDAQRGRQQSVSDADVRRIHADVREQIPGLRSEGFKEVRLVRRKE